MLHVLLWALMVLALATGDVEPIVKHSDEATSRSFGPSTSEGFESFMDLESSDSKSGSFGPLIDADNSKSGGFGFSDASVSNGNSFGKGKGPFGKRGLYVNDLLKSNAPGGETSVQKEIREFIRSTDQAEKLARVEDKRALRALTRVDDYSCTFPGDPKVHGVEYCDTVYDALSSAADFYVINTYGKIDVNANGNSAVIHINYRGVGTYPLFGFELDYSTNARTRLQKNQNGEWKRVQLNFIDDNTNGFAKKFHEKIMTQLRDSIYSAKQQYPDYNPWVIIVGSSVGGIFGLAIVGAWILRKRRSYETMNTRTDV